MTGWIEKIKDPNIELVTKGPWNPNKPLKHWVDKRASNDNDASTEFIYKLFVKPYQIDKQGNYLKRTVVLSREDAGTANFVPTPSRPDEYSPIGEIEFPVRDLLPGEKISIDPFGMVMFESFQKESDALVLARIEEKIDKILETLVK